KPGVRKVAETIYRHAELLAEEFGDEAKGCREIRKHVPWYFKGYPVGGELRAQMAQVPSLARLRDLLDQLDLDLPYPGKDVEGPRGRAGNPRKPHLPDGWLNSRILGDAERLGLVHAELDVSGG
ncbi:MAG: tRNA-dihydrouridine synthase, partial [Kocuria sp.]|nr:tRNA-dihydrouridine synthase [Kocuria sp.]